MIKTDTTIVVTSDWSLVHDTTFSLREVYYHHPSTPLIYRWVAYFSSTYSSGASGTGTTITANSIATAIYGSTANLVGIYVANTGSANEWRFWWCKHGTGIFYDIKDASDTPSDNEWDSCCGNTVIKTTSRSGGLFFTFWRVSAGLIPQLKIKEFQWSSQILE